MGFFSVFKKIFGKEEKPAPASAEAELRGQELDSAASKEENLEAATAPSEIPATPEKDEIATESGEEGAAESRLFAAENVSEAGAAKTDVEESPSEPEEEVSDLVIAEATPASPSAEDDAMLARLRAAEPRLSAWLDIILENIDEADEEFWRRLRFLLTSLDAPREEIDVFLNDFGKWLREMEYVHTDEFRSELQYRMALALELEDEEDERNRLFVKLAEGLGKTREQLGRGLDRLFNSHARLDESFWEELEELFIMADLGYDAAIALTEKLRERAEKEKISDPAETRKLLREIVNEIFAPPRGIKAVNKPEVILLAGVNGAGKTTTIAKLAYREKMRGRKPLIVAADTFRAAAMEQLEVWAKRVGADFYAKKAGSDPAAVAWEGMDYALKNGSDVVFIDTAGRLQTKADLMRELGKIRQILEKKHPGSPHRSILVLDATTGQNALSQAKLFKEAAGINEIILTKLDGTAKGGVAIAVAMRERLPISYVGLGEKLEDLRPFDGEGYAAALLENNEAKK